MRVVKCEYQCQNWIAHGIHGLTIGWAYREHCTTLCVVISICSYCSRVGAAPVLGFTIIVVQRGLLSHSNYSILFSIFLRGTVGKIMKCKTVKHESYNSQTNFWHVNGSNFAQLDMLGFCRLDGDSPDTSTNLECEGIMRVAEFKWGWRQHLH